MDKNAKILIADDSAFMRKVLRDILEGEGFSKFVECTNGTDCVEKYATEQPDLILLDMVMPELDGIGVLKQIGTKAKILVISALGQDQMLKEAKQLGALGYIVKPFENKNVINEVSKALN